VVLPFRREKTYAFAPKSLLPLAHRVTAGQNDATGDGARVANAPWVHYLEGNAGTPELLVAGDGRILAHLDGKAFGRVTYESGSATSSAYANGANAAGGYDSGAATATDLRFYGHIEDPETGLFYNRYRHYDPDTGRYLSPEPLGLMGGLSPFGYAANDPVGIVDPDGLAPVTCVIQGQNDVSASSHTARDAPPRIHPVVATAMAKDIDGKYPAGKKRPVDCAEPAALSAYLLKWEEDDEEVLDPGNTKQVAWALGSITSIEASQAGGHSRSPCPNCSQLFAKLQALYGEPTSNKIKTGYVGPKVPSRRTPSCVNLRAA
jgi:RHS repeat-associated protein